LCSSSNGTHIGVLVALGRRWVWEAVRSRDGYAALGLKDVFATKEEALRSSRVRLLRNFVTFLMDRRFTMAMAPDAPLGASPAKKPHIDQARSPNRARTLPTIPEQQAVTPARDQEAVDLANAQEWRAEHTTRIDKAIIVDRILDLLAGEEDDYDGMTFTASVLLEYLELMESGTSADRLHDSTARAGQLLAPEYTVCSRVP
jgi:hypothetical protein